MNRKMCVISILLYVCLLFEDILNKEVIMCIHSLVGILMLALAFVVDIKRDKPREEEEVVGPYVNFAFLYFLWGRKIENLILYIGQKASVGIILYTVGVIGYTILTSYEYIRFMSSKRIKIKLNRLYYWVLGIEVTMIIGILIMEWIK